MSLTQAALALMGGDTAAATSFLLMLPPPMRADAKLKFQQLYDICYARMLRDPVEFMRFKAPNVSVPLEVEHFRRLVDALFRGDVELVTANVQQMTLDQAVMLYSASGRLIQAHGLLNQSLKSVVSGVDESLGDQSQELSQSNLF